MDSITTAGRPPLSSFEKQDKFQTPQPKPLAEPDGHDPAMTTSDPPRVLFDEEAANRFE